MPKSLEQMAAEGTLDPTTLRALAAEESAHSEFIHSLLPDDSGTVVHLAIDHALRAYRFRVLADVSDQNHA